MSREIVTKPLAAALARSGFFALFAVGLFTSMPIASAQVELKAYANADGYIDVQKLTCGQLAERLSGRRRLPRNLVQRLVQWACEEARGQRAPSERGDPQCDRLLQGQPGQARHPGDRCHPESKSRTGKRKRATAGSNCSSPRNRSHRWLNSGQSDCDFVARPNRFVNVALGASPNKMKVFIGETAQVPEAELHCDFCYKK